jgi:UDP-glucose 4-epimerase
MSVHEQKPVLITGGRGFIGRAIQKLLQRSGYRVVSLDTSTPANLTGSQESAREILGDIRDERQLQRVFEEERFGGIVHLAAVLPTAAQQDPVRATQVNVEGSLHLLEVARRFDSRRLVFGSSLSIYGSYPAERIVSEEDRAAPEDPYGAAKLYVEQLGGAYRHSHGLEFVSLRIGRVVGPGAHSVSSAWRSQIFELLSAKNTPVISLPYVESERVLLVHVDDVARMLVALLLADQPWHPAYNAVCESMLVGDLKHEVERLNPNIRVELGAGQVVGNPRRLDSTRFRQEFRFQAVPIVERLQETTRPTTAS